MTVVIEDQVKRIVEELVTLFPTTGTRRPDQYHFDDGTDVEEVVRYVIARYDISDIGREILSKGE